MNRPATKGAGMGTVGLVAAIVGTMAYGLVYRARQRRNELERPAGNSHLARATFTLGAHGYDAKALEGRRDQNDVPLYRPGIALWCKLDIPRGSGNHPPIHFSVRDGQGTDFPFQFAWVRNGAYLFLPQGYPAVPTELTASISQDGRAVGQAVLPSLPPPARPISPQIDRPWPTLRLTPIRNATAPPGAISFLASAQLLQEGDHITAHTMGSAGSEYEPSDRYEFDIGTSPTVVTLPVNFPRSTYRLYLAVREWRPIPRLNADGSFWVNAGPQMSKTVRSELIAIPLTGSSRDTNGRLASALPAAIVMPVGFAASVFVRTYPSPTVARR